MGSKFNARQKARGDLSRKFVKKGHFAKRNCWKPRFEDERENSRYGFKRGSGEYED